MLLSVFLPQSATHLSVPLEPQTRDLSCVGTRGSSLEGGVALGHGPEAWSWGVVLGAWPWGGMAQERQAQGRLICG